MPFSSNPSKKDLSTKKMTPSPRARARARALLSNENKGTLELGESSFRVYYGETNATIPFMWESQPGTPKHPILFNKNDNIVPPLTPPPSFTLRTSIRECDPSKKGHKHIVLRGLGLFSSILRRSRSHVSPSTWSSSSSSSYSSPLSSSTSSSSTRSSPRKTCRKSHRRSFSFSSPMEKMSLFDGDQHNVEFSSKSMCFGFNKKEKGCYSMQDMKNALKC